jgi:hypothetical protein
LQGRDAEARKLFARLLSRCNDVGLLAEEFDPQTGRMLGNFPQAYSHVGLINCALSLSRQKGPAEERAASVREEAAALRDFDPAYDRYGSISTVLAGVIQPSMSAMPPIATKAVRGSETSRSAKTGLIHRSKTHRKSTDLTRSPRRRG